MTEMGATVKSKTPRTSNKRHWVIFGLGIVSISVLVACGVVFFRTQPNISHNFVEINLEEDDSFTYRFNQSFEVKDDQKETITSIVGLRVVNKTTDGYWFLLKINTTFKDKDDKVKAHITGYFRVQLQTAGSKGSNQTNESFHIYGRSKTDAEFVRYLHGVLHQLLPSVRRELYEDVDGQRTSKLEPEESPILPGPIRMHRQADTKQSDCVLIKNHFNRTDFVNYSSKVDLDVKYAASVSLNKSSGMVSESNVSMYERLNFGEPMKTKNGNDISMMNVTLHSHVTRMKNDEPFIKDEEFKAIETDLFIKLILPIDAKKMKFKKSDQKAPASASQKGKQRKRRGTKEGYISSSISIPHEQKEYDVFEKKVIGINFKGKEQFWVSPYEKWYWREQQRFQLRNRLSLEIGEFPITVYEKQFISDENEKTEPERRKDLLRTPEFCLTALWIRFCVQFSLNIRYSIKARLVKSETSLYSPSKIAVEITPYAAVAVTGEAYASVGVLRGGVYVDGNIIRGSLTAKLSYNEERSPGNKWLLSLNFHMTVCEIEAGLFYQWKKCKVRWGGWWPSIECDWGRRRTILRFGRWSAYRREDRVHHYLG